MGEGICCARLLVGSVYGVASGGNSGILADNLTGTVFGISVAEGP